LEFCQNTGVTLRVSSETYRELITRIRFDSRILNKHPIRTNLAKFGYKFRTEDNYISSYWRKAAISHISTFDYNESFADPSIIMEGEYGITIEAEAEKSDLFSETVKSFYSKISKYSKDDNCDSAAWHDAYCLATVQKLQISTATNAVDSKCLFLTTDKQLIDLQSFDDEMKKSVPLALTPSQLLQLFSFTTAVGDYVETFVTLFSTAATHKGDQLLNNEHIHDILSRISHYDYYKPEVAERILEAQLFRGGYNPEADDVEKEETIYKAISKELLYELEQEHDENVRLWESKSELETTIVQKNEDSFRMETERQRNTVTIKKQSHEIDILVESEARRRYKRWRTGHIACIITSCLLFFAGVCAIIFFAIQATQQQTSIAYMN